MEEQKSYFAIIPANVRYDEDLTPNAKLLYGEITALCNERGYCWAQNSYFADLYKVSKTSVSKWIAALIEKGYIRAKITYKEGSKEIDKRCLTIVNTPIEEKLNTPLEEKLKENSTGSNNTTNNTKESKKGYDALIEEMVEESVRQSVYEFIKMRKLIKKPMTDYALKRMLTKLKTLSSDPATQEKILEKSIVNNWQDIYALKEDAPQKKKADGAEYADLV